MASTLALGSSGYALLDKEEAPSNAAKVSFRSRRNVGQAVVTPRGSLEDFGIGGDAEVLAGSQKVSVRGGTDWLTASLGAGSDTLSLSGEATNAHIYLDDTPEKPLGYEPPSDASDGSDRLTASSLRDSYVWAGGGGDTIRMTGSADDTLFDLGSGGDVLSVSGNSKALNVAAGAGNDSLQFNGGLGGTTLSGGTDDLPGANSRIDAGAGDDTVVINGGVLNTHVFLGDGNDSLVVRGGGDALGVDASQGSDTISLSGDFNDTYLGLGGGDRVSVDGDFSGSVE
jgi:hypothetical protein